MSDDENDPGLPNHNDNLFLTTFKSTIIINIGNCNSLPDEFDSVLVSESLLHEGDGDQYGGAPQACDAVHSDGGSRLLTVP